MDEHATFRIEESILCKSNYGELFFPGEYVQMCACPQNGWAEVRQELKTAPIFNETGRVAVPVDMFGHVTHKDQADNIKPHGAQTSYTFKTNPKYGKDYPDKSSIKISKQTFRAIENSERLISGNLSWWRVDTHSWYNSDGQAFFSAVDALRHERHFVSPFMSTERESRYGDYGFVVNFKNLLKCYQESRTDITTIEDRALFLRVGGTLRYCYEICYVVIVCTKHDRELQDCYPSLYNCSDIFDHKGLLHPSGQLETIFFESKETIDFKIKHPIKCVPDRQYTCYEIPAFAFYYPEPSTASTLKCPLGKVEEVQMTHKCENFDYKCRK